MVANLLMELVKLVGQGSGYQDYNMDPMLCRKVADIQSAIGKRTNNPLEYQWAMREFHAIRQNTSVGYGNVTHS